MMYLISYMDILYIWIFRLQYDDVPSLIYEYFIVVLDYTPYLLYGYIMGALDGVSYLIYMEIYSGIR